MLGDQHKRHHYKLWLISAVVVGLFSVSACGGTSSSENSGGSTNGDPTITYLGASNIPVRVAIDQGFYKGVNVKFKEVGEDQETSLFIGGDAELGAMSPWSAAKFNAEGEDIKFLSTAGATNLINGVLIRSEDADKYKTIEDLEGEKLGVPGFGSDTWAAFETVVNKLYDDDAKSSFQTVTADSGAELGLLGTGQIEGALLTSGTTATGMALPQFKLIFSFTEEWQKVQGQPLIVDGLAAKGEWAKAHPDLVQDVVNGTDRAVTWMSQHPDEFDSGGKYEDLASAEGWLEDPKATKQILALIKQGDWYLNKNRYTKSWIDSLYQFIQDGKGVLVTGDIPPANEIFYPASG